MKNILMAISGPSGVGKGTLVKALLARRKDLIESVSCTTRAPRKGERDGREYFFLKREEFLSRIEKGDFLEYDEHFGNFYGTPKSFVKEALKEKSVILEIDVVGALNAKKAFPECPAVGGRAEKALKGSEFGDGRGDRTSAFANGIRIFQKGRIRLHRSQRRAGRRGKQAGRNHR